MTPIVNTLRRAGSPALFLAVVAGVYATAFYVRSLFGAVDSSDVLAGAVVLDITVLVPIAYYFLVVRRFGWPVVSVAGVFVLSLIAATRIIPAEYRLVLAPVEVAAILAEVGVVGFIVWKVTSGVRRYRAVVGAESDDAFAAIRSETRRLIDSPRVADALAFEIGLIFYGLFSWRRRPPRGLRHYPDYGSTGYGAVLAGLGVILAVELIAVHVLVHIYWNDVGAWILSLISAYGGVWLAAEWQTHRLRPTTIDKGILYLRSGLRWEVEVPLEHIGSLRRVSALEDKPRGTLDLVPFGDPIFELITTAPVEARGTYGFRRKTTRVRFTVDDPACFEKALLGEDH